LSKARKAVTLDAVPPETHAEKLVESSPSAVNIEPVAVLTRTAYPLICTIPPTPSITIMSPVVNELAQVITASDALLMPVMLIGAARADCISIFVSISTNAIWHLLNYLVIGLRYARNRYCIIH